MFFSSFTASYGESGGRLFESSTLYEIGGVKPENCRLDKAADWISAIKSRLLWVILRGHLVLYRCIPSRQRLIHSDLSRGTVVGTPEDCPMRSTSKFEASGTEYRSSEPTSWLYKSPSCSMELLALYLCTTQA